MVVWLGAWTQASTIKEPHWEKRSYGDAHATGFSIFLVLEPVEAGGVDRETAFFAMEEFRSLIAVFGAMEGKFEIWSFGLKRSIARMYVFAWPTGSIKTSR